MRLIICLKMIDLDKKFCHIVVIGIKIKIAFIDSILHNNEIVLEK